MLLKKKSIKIISFSLIFLVIFMFSVVLASDDSVYVWSSQAEPITQETNASEAEDKEAEENSNSLNLESGGAILIEQKTGKVLYDHNMHEQLRPASVTKVMSLLLIMEALDSGQISLTDKVPCSEEAAGMGGITGWPWIRYYQCADTDARRHRGTKVLPYLLSLGYRKIWGTILAPGTSDPPLGLLPDAQNPTRYFAHQIRTAI